MLIQKGKVPLAFISDTELNVVVKGRKPFKTPMTNLRLLMSPYVPASRFQATQTIANKAWADKHGIVTFADIAKKKPPMRIVVNRPGNLDGDVSITTLKMIGVSLGDIKSWGGQVVRAASREMTSLILDRRVDVVSLGISYRHPRIREMANGLDVAMLPMSDEVAGKTAETMGAKLCHIKAGEYKFLARDSASVCVGMTLVVRADMSEQLAYNVTKGVFDNIDKFKAAHRLLKKVVTPARLAQAAQVPFHPGAARYLREKGLLK
jgi:TRAP transporter TAXI family solute receptor